MKIQGFPCSDCILSVPQNALRRRTRRNPCQSQALALQRHFHEALATGVLRVPAQRGLREEAPQLLPSARVARPSRARGAPKSAARRFWELGARFGVGSPGRCTLKIWGWASKR